MAKLRPLGLKCSEYLDRYLKERFLYILKSRVLPIYPNNFSKLDRNEKIKGDRRNPLNRLCCTRTANKSVCHHCLVLKLPACEYVFHSERKLIEHLIDQEEIIQIQAVLSEAELKVLCQQANPPQTGLKQTVSAQPGQAIAKRTDTTEPFCEPSHKLPATLSHQKPIEHGQIVNEPVINSFATRADFKEYFESMADTDYKLVNNPGKGLCPFYSMAYLETSDTGWNEQLAVAMRDQGLDYACQNIEKLKVLVDGQLMANPDVDSPLKFRDYYMEYDEDTGYKYAERELLMAVSHCKKRPIFLLHQRGNEQEFEYFNENEYPEKAPFLIYLAGEHYQAIELNPIEAQSQLSISHQSTVSDQNRENEPLKDEKDKEEKKADNALKSKILSKRLEMSRGNTSKRKGFFVLHSRRHYCILTRNSYAVDQKGDMQGCRRPQDPSKSLKQHLAPELRTAPSCSKESREQVQQRQWAHLEEGIEDEREDEAEDETDDETEDERVDSALKSKILAKRLEMSRGNTSKRKGFFVLYSRRHYCILTRNSYAVDQSSGQMHSCCTRQVKKLSTAYVCVCVGCRRRRDLMDSTKTHLSVELRTEKRCSKESRKQVQQRQRAHLEESSGDETEDELV